ncbi:hypothetical protein ACQ4LE_005442 [Meloidogyne hapla]
MKVGLITVLSIFIMVASQGVFGGVSAPLPANFPINHSAARITQNRTVLPLKVHSSTNSNNGPAHLSINHRNNPQSVVVSKDQKHLVNNLELLEKPVLKQNANANEHYLLEKSIKAQVENEFELSGEKSIRNALREAIITKSPMKVVGKFSKYFEEFVTMILGDKPTVTNFGQNQGFQKYILVNGSKTIMELTEFDNINGKHQEFFERAISLANEEERLEKYKMAGNKLTDEEIEGTLKYLIIKGTNEEKLMKEILNVLNIQEPEQSLIGKMYMHELVLNNCIDFLKNLFSNDYDVVADNETKASRTMKLDMIEKMETMKIFLDSTQKILRVLKH